MMLKLATRCLIAAYAAATGSVTSKTFLGKTEGAALLETTSATPPPRALYATSWAEVFDREVEVQGKLPEWIPHGSWVRQGPAIFEMGGRNVSVLLDGGAKLTKLVFPGAGAAPRVSQALLRGPLLEASIKANTICPFISLNPPTPPWTVSDHIKCGLPDNPGFANVETWIYGKEMVAVADGIDRHQQVSRDLKSATKFQLSRFNNNPVDQVTFNGAHPIKQVNDSSVTMQIYTSIVPSHVKSGEYHITLTAIHRDEPRTVKELIQASMPYGPVMHQFHATDRYVVTVAPSMAMPVGFGEQINWVPEMGSTVIVFDLHTLAATTFHSKEPFVLTHVANTWVENDRLYSTVVSYKDDCVYNGKQMSMASLRNGSSIAAIEECPAALARVSTPFPSENADPLKSNIGPEGSVQIEHHSVMQSGKAITAEMPRINPKFLGKINRYFYAVSVPGDKTFKVDTRPHGNFSNTPVATVVQSYEKGNHVSEPTFIPRPGATEEDDGVLLLHEYVPGPGNASATNECEKEGCTHTVVLDAQTFKTLARMPLGFAVPAPLHAAFFPDYE
jgi:carlactone synthase/all-trans-10'-apo-beta-carotenal 13,14-cleaving dioxygenase